jgi:nickel transport protein
MSYEALSTPENLEKVNSKDASPRRGASFLLSIPRVSLIWAGLAVLLLVSSPVFAHKVNMFAYVEGNKVMMEGYFADGNKPMNCEVIVTNPDKKVLVKGLTDNEGKFSFDIPEITDLKIALIAGMGHRAEYVISRSELTGVTPVGAAAPASPDINQAAEAESTAGSSDTDSVSSNINEAILRKAVAEANLPLLRAIEELKEGASFSNIIGGIGFIFGIVGIFFYTKARKLLGQSSAQSIARK